MARIQVPKKGTFSCNSSTAEEAVEYLRLDEPWHGNVLLSSESWRWKDSPGNHPTWKCGAAMTFRNFCRGVSWRSKVLGAVAGSKLLLCKVTPRSHGESRNTHCFQEPGFKDERGVPELLSFAALRVASVFISETNSPMEDLREEDVVFVGSAFAFNRQSLATCDICREEDFQLRVQHALLGALLGDSFAWNRGEPA
ncbi:unnamed protein product [Cladocopium goreaui]|uniref:Uncharacterized protein n=1 Tax=Cladocopium goreaui TaxID=2562237 RepID=A0A9P1FM01_9DINO|nr:unnamed protein product [Cladocopium goreaui]